jgi:hypothetical protein
MVVVGVSWTLPLVAPPVVKPVPVQLVAFALVQARSLLPPSGTEEGVAVRVTVTAGPTVTVTLAGVLVAPPGPPQVST